MHSTWILFFWQLWTFWYQKKDWCLIWFSWFDTKQWKSGIKYLPMGKIQNLKILTYSWDILSGCKHTHFKKLLINKIYLYKNQIFWFPLWWYTFNQNKKNKIGLSHSNWMCNTGTFFCNKKILLIKIKKNFIPKYAISLFTFSLNDIARYPHIQYNYSLHLMI